MEPTELLSPTESPTDQRRAHILQAAAGVFAERGFARATMKEIAGRADIAPGTIYLYFKNKRDLLLAIADRLITRTVDESLSAAAHLSAEAYVSAVLRERVRFARENQALIQALVTEIWTDRELQELFFSEVIGPVFGMAVGYLEARVAEGKLRPCRSEVILPAVVGSVALVSLIHAMAPDRFLSDVSEDEIVDELTRLFYYGLQPRSSEPQP